MNHVEFTLYNPNLSRLKNVIPIKANYAGLINGVGSATIYLSADCHDFGELARENLGLMIMAGDTNLKPDLDAYWLLESISYLEDSEQYQLDFVHANDILQRRRVAFLADLPFGESPQARIAGPGNVEMVRVVRENLGDLALNRSVGNALTVAKPIVPSLRIDKLIHFRNVLEVMKETCRTSIQKGQPLYFDTLAREVNGKVQLVFKTFAGARGKIYSGVRIRTTDPLFKLNRFSIDWNVPNTAYVAGSGKGIYRPVVEVSHPRAEAGIFARRETYKSVQTANKAVLTDAAYAKLEDTGIYYLNGTILDDCDEYQLGDVINVEHKGILIEGEISSVRVSVEGQTYKKILTVESR